MRSTTSRRIDNRNSFWYVQHTIKEFQRGQAQGLEAIYDAQAYVELAPESDLFCDLFVPYPLYSNELQYFWLG